MPPPTSYLFHAHDHPTALPIRKSVRPVHLAQLAALMSANPGLIHIGGPSLDADGNANGSVIIFTGVTEERIREIVSDDPYMTAGVWKDYEIVPFASVLVGDRVNA